MFKELFEAEKSPGELAKLVKKAMKGYYEGMSIPGISSKSLDLVVIAKSEKEARKIKGPEIEKILRKELPNTRFDKNSTYDLYHGEIPYYQSYDWKDESGKWEVYIPFKFIK